MTVPQVGDRVRYVGPDIKGYSRGSVLRRSGDDVGTVVTVVDKGNDRVLVECTVGNLPGSPGVYHAETLEVLA